MSKIPEGFTSLTPYAIFDDVAAAIEFYKKALNVTENMRMPGPDGKVAYAELQIGNARFMMGGICPEAGGKSARSFGGSPISFYHYVENIETAFAQAKAAGMKEKKAPEDMFWGDRMGTLVDPFQVEWTFAEHIKDVSPEEIKEALKKMNA